MRSDKMLIGLFISPDDKKSEDAIGMLKAKFQGIEFISLKDLNDDLTMATLAKGSFDKVIVHVNAFTGLKGDAIISELNALKAYKELRANGVQIQIVDRLNKSTNRGILEGSYRKLFGSFVDCQYYIKKTFNGSTLVELIRDIDIGNDYFENFGKTNSVNKSMVSALASDVKETPKYTTKDVGPLPKSNANENGKKSTEVEETAKEPIKQSQSSEQSKVQSKPAQKPKKRGFSIFGRKKFNVVEPDLEKMPVAEVEPVEPTEQENEKVVENPKEEVKKETEVVKEPIVREPIVEEKEIEGRVIKEKEVDPSKFTSTIRDIPDEDISDFLYGDLEEKEIKGRELNSKFKTVDSAVSRQPEVVEEPKVEMNFKAINEQVEQTNMFSLPTELSSEESILKEQMKLKELELKTRMLEAQAKIKETELETSQRETLLSPTRITEEKVTGYVNSNKGRAKIILVTGLKSSGKTTATKLIGEILKELGFVIDLDLDFEGRTLSESFSRLDENELTKLGAFRALRDAENLQRYIVPIDGNLDVLGTYIDLSEAEQNSLEKRLDPSLIQPMLRKLCNSGVYGNIVVDCPLELLKDLDELLDISDYVFWTCRGSRHGIRSMINELSKPCYDEFFFNKLTVVLNGEQNQSVVWKRFFNTSSMWSDDICDSLGAIIPYIEGYDDYLWHDITGLSLKDFRENILEILDLI